MRSHTIAICGSGIAGLATALALQARGHHVSIFEKIAAPRPIGSGLMLQPTGQAALARLGLLTPVLAHARNLAGISGTTISGKTIFDINYAALGPGIFGLGIHRGTLFHILDTERQRRSISLVSSAEITASRIDGPRRLISNADGTAHGAYDLVIDATGLHSPLRHAHAKMIVNKPYPYGAVWGVVHEPPDAATPHTLAQRYDGAHTMIGLLPIGRLPGSAQPLTAFFWSLKTAAMTEWQAADFSAWQDQVAKLWPASEPYVRQFKAPADLSPATYADVWLDLPFAERLVFVGDAARATSPQLGQGANLALIDAVVLSDCLDENPTIADGLAAFASARRAHTRFYGLASRWLTPFFQSDSRLAALARDLSFAPMANIPYFNREMTRTLAGLKTGPFSHRTPNGLVGDRPIEPAQQFSAKARNGEPTAPAAD